MPYRHLTDACFDSAIGEHGLTAAEYGDVLAETAPALARLRQAFESRTLPLLRLPEARADLEALRSLVRHYRGAFDHVVVLGTGGSSLGGQTLCALAEDGFGPRPGAPRLLFMDNIDPHTFARLLESLDLSRTGVLAISKSGTTAETHAQLSVCIAALTGAVGADGLATRLAVITEPGDNPLRRRAVLHGAPVLDHDPGIGGRFAALSLVGLLPAMIAGLDAAAVRAGAGRVLDAALAAAEPGACAPAVGAAISVALMRHRFLTVTVLMAYVDRLAHFGLWYRQLWAESLGKDGKGTTPISALGATDQHSQLQLYLDGPRDKMFTLLTLDVAGRGPRILGDLAEDPELAYLRGRRLGDLMDAEQRATADTLARNGRPVRVFHLAWLDERALGALFMHFMIETIITARLLGIDPFDQPAVEEGKQLARAYLSGETGGDEAGGGPAR